MGRTFTTVFVAIAVTLSLALPGDAARLDEALDDPSGAFFMGGCRPPPERLTLKASETNSERI